MLESAIQSTNADYEVLKNPLISFHCPEVLGLSCLLTLLSTAAMTEQYHNETSGAQVYLHLRLMTLTSV